MSKYFTVLAALLTFLTALPLQGAGSYERKSISYIDALWLATPAARQVKPAQVDYMLRAVKAEIEMPRFDYNPLPESLIREFVDAANAQPTISVESLAALMERKLAPRIMEILQASMTERAGELVSEEQRQSFLATKAKELGITLTEMEKVMNSGYIYLPVLTNLKREETKTEGRYIYTIEGGVIWFHLNTAGDQPRVIRRVAATTLSKGLGSDKFAYQSAVRNFARNLEVLTRDIEEFKLSAPIAEMDGGKVKFDLGVREGIKTDQVFWVGEWVYNPSGNPVFVKNGWVRVGKIADNTQPGVQRSSAWAVKNGGWAAGMTLVEHPRLPIDIALKPNASQLTVSSGWMPVLVGRYIEIVEDYDALAPGFDIDAQYNLAPATGSRQLFMLVGGSFTWPATLEFKSSDFTLLTTSAPFVWGLHLGMMKRWYLGQFAVSGEAKVGMKFFTVEQDFSWLFEDFKYTISNNSLGVQVGLNWEYAASPDFNIGLLTGYKAYTVSDSWTLSIEPDIADAYLVMDDYFPEVNHSGLILGVYMHWTPPQLPFDPADWIRGAMGE